MTQSQLLLAFTVAALLSVLGPPWLPFARRGRGAAVPIGTRWALFQWYHPVLAGALRWGAASAAAGLLAWGCWTWVAGNAGALSTLQGAAGRMFGAS